MTQTHQDKKCSECGSVNNYHEQWIENKWMIRCLKCAHMKVQAESFTSSTGNSATIYQAPQMPLTNIF